MGAIGEARSVADLVRISKFLSKHLRHDPAGLGLTLEAGGWVEVEVLLAACARRGVPISRALLLQVVAGSDKQRFGLDAEGLRIRANQGHSVTVDLQLTSQEPPARLFHGTTSASLPAILREGLKRMQRHHVHLSADEATARKVGGAARRGGVVGDRRCGDARRRDRVLSQRQRGVAGRRGGAGVPAVAGGYSPSMMTGLAKRDLSGVPSG